MNHTEIIKLLKDSNDMIRKLIAESNSQSEVRLAVKVIETNQNYISDIECELQELYQQEKENQVQFDPIEELNQLFESFNPNKQS